MAKKKRKKNNNLAKLSPKKYIVNNARKLAIGKCYINDNWEEDGIASIYIIRKHKGGAITVGFYLVDLYCKGVKDTGFIFNESISVFEEGVLDDDDSLVECEYKLVHNIIFESISYADNLEFFPHKDFEITEYILEEDDGSIGDIEIKTGGENGKPLLIEYDPIQYRKDYNLLMNIVGEGNFDYIDNFDDDIEDELDIEQFSIDVFLKFLFEIVYEKHNHKKYDIEFLATKDIIEGFVYYECEKLSKNAIDYLEKSNVTKQTVLDLLSNDNFKIPYFIEILEEYVLFERYKELKLFSEILMAKFPESIIPKYYLINYYIINNNYIIAFYLYDSFKDNVKSINDFYEYIFFNNASALINIAKDNIVMADSYVYVNMLLSIRYDYMSSSFDNVQNLLLECKNEFVDEYIYTYTEDEQKNIEKEAKNRFNKHIEETTEMFNI